MTALEPPGKLVWKNGKWNAPEGWRFWKKGEKARKCDLFFSEYDGTTDKVFGVYGWVWAKWTEFMILRRLTKGERAMRDRHSL